MNSKTAYFAGGCFWCITPAFNESEGVFKVTSGYCGGSEVNPTYNEVKSQQTGHRETIKIDYDADKISFDKLLDIFINGVDPFDEGGQFIDRGHSYTLAVYYNNDKEKEYTEKIIAELEKTSGRKVYIALEPFGAFYSAEEEHQNYYINHPEEFEKELIESGRKKI
ncbi:MAG: peptide-methionine (S)-S-oxide reductase MsrA [Oscillospiraceae bacterium]|nr:peptide-methionine (S)-S-oxide reductase MsrA [Oscillospiraceae bacterium]